MKRSSFLDTKFSCFFEMSFLGVVLNDEASHIIPPRYPHDLFWHWLLIRPIVIQCAYPWRDLSIIVNKSCQSFPCNNSWVLPRVRINQFHYLWCLHEIFWHWLLIHPIVIQCAYPWRELSISVNKSCQSFPCMNSLVSPHVRTNQSQLSFMTRVSFGTKLLLLVVMILFICDS